MKKRTFATIAIAYLVLWATTIIFGVEDCEVYIKHHLNFPIRHIPFEDNLVSVGPVPEIKDTKLPDSDLDPHMRSNGFAVAPFFIVVKAKSIGMPDYYYTFFWFFGHFEQMKNNAEQDAAGKPISVGVLDTFRDGMEFQIASIMTCRSAARAQNTLKNRE